MASAKVVDRGPSVGSASTAVIPPVTTALRANALARWRLSITTGAAKARTASSSNPTQGDAAMPIAPRDAAPAMAKGNAPRTPARASRGASTTQAPIKSSIGSTVISLIEPISA